MIAAPSFIDTLDVPVEVTRYPQPTVIVAAGPESVSPDDLAGITPLWTQAVDEQLLPVVAEVYQDAAGTVHTSLIDAAGLGEIPPVTSLASEAYLAGARNTFAEVGSDLWETARSELLDGMAAGESIPELRDRLRASAGLTGRTATLVARTQVLDASNAGSYDTARVSGLDLLKGWEATPDVRTRPSHMAAGTFYQGDSMIPLADPFTVGGFQCERPHDLSLPAGERYNCFPGETLVKAGTVEAAYRRWFVGPLIEVITAKGKKLAGTTNHPVLTCRGWVTLDQLVVGDQLWCYEIDSNGSGSHDVRARPAQIGEVFDALSVVRNPVRVSRLRVDFHGERPQRDVDVVSAYRELGNRLLAPADQGVENLTLPPPDVGAPLLPSFGRPTQRHLAARGSSDCVVSSSSQGESFFHGGLGHPGEHGGAPVSALDAMAEQEPTEGRSGCSGLQSEALLGLAGQIGTDKIISVRRRPWSGHVYNLQTAAGTYVANGIIVHNCRCTLVYAMAPVVPTPPEAQLSDLEARHARRLAQIEAQHQARLAEAQARHAQRLAELDAADATETVVQVAQSRHAARLAKLAAGFEARRAVLVAEHDRRLMQLRGGRPLPSAVGPEPEIPPTMPGVGPTPVPVRASLMQAETVPAVQRAFLQEWSAIGSQHGIYIPPRAARFEVLGDVQTAREHAEGLLRAAERFPRVPMAVSHRTIPHYAQADLNTMTIQFGNQFARDRDAYLASLRQAGTPNWQGIAWHPATTSSPQGVAIHEFGHLLHRMLSPLEPDPTVTAVTVFRYSTKVDDAVKAVVRDLAAERGVPEDELIMREIGEYAAMAIPGGSPTHELIGEAFADAMVNGQGASALSRRIMAVLVDEYDRTTGVGPVGPSLGRVLPTTPRPVTPPTVVPIRPSLRQAEDISQVEQVFLDEWRTATAGVPRPPKLRPAQVTFHGDLDTAREHAEGLLRSLERFPLVRLKRIDRGNNPRHYAETESGVEIRFSDVWTRDRPAYLASVAESAARRWHPPSISSPAGVAMHEFGHALVFRVAPPTTTVDLLPNPAHAALMRRVSKVVRDGAAARGLPEDEWVKGELGEYATSDIGELVGEAFADVMVNGDAASVLSRQVMAVLVDEYERLGAGSRTMAAAQVDPLARGVAEALQALTSGKTITEVRAILEALPEAKDALKIARRATTTQGLTRSLNALATRRGLTLPSAKELKAIQAAERAALVAERKAARAAAAEAARVVRAEKARVAEAKREAARLAKEEKARQAEAARLAKEAGASKAEIRLIRLSEQTPTGTRQLGGGAMADVRLLTYPDGSQIVEKIYGPRSGATLAEVRSLVDSEVLGAKVFETLGVRAPVVVQAGVRGRLVMEYMDGEVGGGPYVSSRAHAALEAFMAQSDEGRLFGLADVLIGNTDRNSGNWLLTHDRHFIGIDFGSAFQDRGVLGVQSRSAFTRYLLIPDTYRLAKTVDVAPEDLAIIRRRLEALEPRFAEAKRLTWFRQMMRRLAELEKRASGTRRIITS